MKTSEEFIVDVKTKAGDQRTRDGQLIRDMDDKELMKRMLERYPGERENIVDIDEYLGEEVKALPEPPPKSDVQQRLDEVKKSPSFLERQKNKLTDFIGDTVDTVKDVAGTVMEGAKDIGETWQRDDINPVQKVAATLGEAGSTVAEGVGEVTIGAGKAMVNQDAEDAVGALTQKLATTIAETDTAQAAYKKTKDWYDGLDTSDKVIVDSAGGMAAFMSEVLGLGVAKKVAKPIAEGITDAVEVTSDAIAKVPGKIDEVMEPRRQAKIEQRKAEADDAVKRIIQPTGKTTAERASQLEASKRVLSEVDANDIPDYQSGKEVFDERIKTIAENQDAHMAQFTEKYKPDQLGTYTKVGDETVATNPVQDALDGLENAYTLSGDAVEATKIKQLRAKMESEGLTVSEINKIARDYNIEFKNKAFDKMGNPKAGFNAENYESVRKGVKQVARDRMPDDISKELDAKLSDTYEVRSLFDRLAVEVDKLGAKANEPGMLARVAGGAVELTDILSGRLLGGVLRTLASKSGILQKGRVSFADLEKELQSNIKKFQKANSTNDPQKFSEYLSEIKPGLSTNNEINPE
jgi:hypothetical protein